MSRSVFGACHGVAVEILSVHGKMSRGRNLWKNCHAVKVEIWGKNSTGHLALVTEWKLRFFERNFFGSWKIVEKSKFVRELSRSGDRDFRKDLWDIVVKLSEIWEEGGDLKFVERGSFV